MKCAIVLAVMSTLVAVPAFAFEAQQGPAVKASTVKPPGSNSQPERACEKPIMPVSIA